ncbi:MAG: sigma 54-interacting transcriptional regulator [bacterium]|nr:sigma-54-dependent Fis family transcriptional regulator [Myxococcales bacterium]
MSDLLTASEPIAVCEAALGNPFSAHARRLHDSEVAAFDDRVADWAGWWRRHTAVWGADPMFTLAAYVGLRRDAEGDPGACAAATARRVAVLAGLGVPVDEAMAELACRARAVRRALDALVGDGAEMARVREAGWKAAFGDRLDLTPSLAELIRRTPVLIVGEPGTGKELLAQSLLLASPGAFAEGRWTPPRTDSVNLAGLPADLVAGTLFGHEKGAYTGAAKARAGLLERCAGGAVFLDEVADLPPQAQVGLLRCLQEGRVRRLGADADVEAAPRILSATHRDLDALVGRERFRVDLHHRLSAVVIQMPPLMARRGDILPLAERVLGMVGPDAGHALLDKLRALVEGPAAAHRWPGNVRELIAVLHALALGMEPRLMTGSTPVSDEVPDGILEGTWSEREVQAWYADRVVRRAPNHTVAAERLGVHRNTLAARLKDLRG